MMNLGMSFFGIIRNFEILTFIDLQSLNWS